MVKDMERRYVNADRYKKVPKRASRKRTVRKITTNSNLKTKKTQDKKMNNKKYKVSKSKFIRLVFCLIVLTVIAIGARIATIEQDEPFIPIFSNNEVKENIESINIAIYDNTNLDSNNQVITELEQYIYPMLLRIGEDYLVEYEIISNITKINNREYDIDIIESQGITAVDIKDTIDSIITTKNKYYYKVENVEKIEVKAENKVKITLKNEDEYFIYNLNIPIRKTDEKFGIYNVDNSSNDNELKLVRKDSANKEYIKYINVLKVDSENKAIEMYKENKIDVFFCSSNNVTKMLGKYEYDLKAYNSGESIFLVFNPASKLAKEKYIRQIVAYGIDRENIQKEVTGGNGKTIDLPYIYDAEKYKYDVYAVDNLLLSNGYVKNNLYYSKGGKNLTLKLLVNQEDTEKINVANKIKNDLLKIGVNVTVNKLNENQIQNNKNTSNYDLLLASIYINENPNINHLTNDISLTDEISNRINMIKTSDMSKLKGNISSLKNVLSDEIAIYGMYSKNNYIVYRKGLDIFKNINYMNLFSGYFDK